MTGEPETKGAPHPSTDERAQEQDVLGLGERERDYLLAWVGENLTLGSPQPWAIRSVAPGRCLSSGGRCGRSSFVPPSQLR